MGGREGEMLFRAVKELIKGLVADSLRLCQSSGKMTNAVSHS